MNQKQTLALWAKCQAAKRAVLEDLADSGLDHDALEEEAQKAAAKLWNEWAGSKPTEGCDFRDVQFCKRDDFKEQPDTTVTDADSIVLCDGKIINFTGFKFTGPARFEKARFQQAVSYSDFESDALFAGAQFDEIASFCSFFGLADFSEVSFSPMSVFAGDFKKDALFSKAHFFGAEKSACWFESVFYGETIFDDAYIQGAVEFVKAEFLGAASFRSCTFFQPCSFKETKIHQFIDFGNAQFGSHPLAFEFRTGMRPEQVRGASILRQPIQLPATQNVCVDLTGVSLDDIPTYDSFYIESWLRGDRFEVRYHSDRFQQIYLGFGATMPFGRALDWRGQDLPFCPQYDTHQGYMEEIFEEDGFVYAFLSNDPQMQVFQRCFRIPTKRYETAWENALDKLRNIVDERNQMRCNIQQCTEDIIHTEEEIS